MVPRGCALILTEEAARQVLVQVCKERLVALDYPFLLSNLFEFLFKYLTSILLGA